MAGWLTVGVAGALAELALLWLLRDVLGVWLPMATFVAAETLILAKFLAVDSWVFGHTRPTWERLLKYHGASAGALVIYWLVINGLSELGGMPYVLAFFVGTAAAFAWSLVTNFLWVWARGNPPPVNQGG